VLFVYLAAGVVYGKFKRQAEGKDIIPNLAFWSVIPGLIKVSTGSFVT